MIENIKKNNSYKAINHKKYLSLLVNLILITLFVFLFLNFISKKELFSSSKSSSPKEKRQLEETKDNKAINVIPYTTPNKIETVLDYLFYPYHSDIIRDMDDYEFIRDCLGKVNLRLLFSSEYYGDYAQDVHVKANYHHLIVLIETDKGNRFGGYTSDNFNPESLGLTSTSIDVVKPDRSAFLFNLDKKKYYEIKQDKVYQALECDDYFVLNFGGSDLLIKDHFLTEGGSSTFPDHYGENAEQSELTNGEKFFKVKNFEIFQALFYSEFGDEKNKMGAHKNFIK